jgi:hypothetical protein
MLDDLRNPSEQPYGENPIQADDFPQDDIKPPTPRFLGMTPFQRFVIVFLIFMLVCVLGSFCLLVTEKVVPPIF